MIDYTPLWQLLDARDIKKTQLRSKAGLSSSTFAKLGKNLPVALNVLVRLCLVLDCQLSDICHVTLERSGYEIGQWNKSKEQVSRSLSLF